MEKVKLKDIAKEAGVSVATVSYVLNNNPNQKINEATRKKILQISSILGYSKNSYANALATGKSNHIGIYLGNYDFALANSDNLKFITQLIDSLKINGYDAILLPHTFTKSIDFVDAILCVSISEEDFRTICRNNIIPVIGIDTKVHEPWIFEICNDFDNIKDKFALDDYLFLSYDYNSAGVKEAILSHNKNVRFISSFVQLDNLKTQLENRTIIAVGDELFDYLKKMNVDVIRYPLHYSKKISRILNCLKLAIDHVDTETHVFAID